MSESPTCPAAPRTALVTGAAGFIAGFIVAALQTAGWRVLRGVRRPRPGAIDEIAIDFSQLCSAGDWQPLLQGVHAVVNCAGILRESAGQTFARVHELAPLALAEACVACGVPSFVQISALGDPADGEFVASKQRFDRALLDLPLKAVVLRPSVVYSAAGSYGGTSLLRALAATPALMLLPGSGRQRLQPLAAEDLAQLVLNAIDSPSTGCYQVGGPHSIELRDYLQRWRHWLRLPAVPRLPVPTPLVGLLVSVGEAIGRGPLGATSWRMLQRGNVTTEDAHRRLQDTFGCAPRALAEVLGSRPSTVQDRWQAQLYLLAPLLRVAVLALFLLSAWAGFATDAERIRPLVDGSLLQDANPVLLARLAAGFDLALAGALLLPAVSRHAVAAMLLLVASYTLVFGSVLPALWLDPLGGLAKNLVVIPALAILWVLLERR